MEAISDLCVEPITDIGLVTIPLRGGATSTVFTLRNDLHREPFGLTFGITFEKDCPPTPDFDLCESFFEEASKVAGDCHCYKLVLADRRRGKAGEPNPYADPRFDEWNWGVVMSRSLTASPNGIAAAGDPSVSKIVPPPPIGNRFCKDVEGKRVGRTFLYVVTDPVNRETVGFVEDVHVAEEATAEVGLGRRLNRAAIEAAGAAGCAVNVLTVRHSKPRVANYYRRFGYEVDGLELRRNLVTV